MGVPNEREGRTYPSIFCGRNLWICGGGVLRNSWVWSRTHGVEDAEGSREPAAPTTYLAHLRPLASQQHEWKLVVDWTAKTQHKQALNGRGNIHNLCNMTVLQQRYAQTARTYRHRRLKIHSRRSPKLSAGDTMRPAAPNNQQWVLKVERDVVIGGQAETGW